MPPWIWMVWIAVCIYASAGARLRQRRQRRQIRHHPSASRRRRGIGRRLRQFDIDQHVRLLVLHRLERGDGCGRTAPADWHSPSADCRSRSAPPTISLARHTAACVIVLANGAAPPPSSPSSSASTRAELQPRLLAGRVHHLQRPARQAGRIAAHGEERQPVIARRTRAARQHDDQVGACGRPARSS